MHKWRKMAILAYFRPRAERVLWPTCQRAVYRPFFALFEGTMSHLRVEDMAPKDLRPLYGSLVRIEDPVVLRLEEPRIFDPGQ